MAKKAIKKKVYSRVQKRRVLDKIYGLISGGDSVRNILRDSKLPTQDTFYKWIGADEKEAESYVRACETRQEGIFEDIINIADDGTNDYMTITKGNETYNVEDKEVTQRSKIRIDARKWMLGKMNPSKYGDKIHTEHSGKVETTEQVFIIGGIEIKL